MFYFTDSKSLISDHIHNRFSDKDIVSYIIFYFCETALINLFNPQSKSVANADFSMTTYFFGAMTILFFCWVYDIVLRKLWKANGGDQSRHLMNRLVSLCCVFQFRAVLVLIPLAILFKIVTVHGDTNSILLLAIALVIGALYALFYIYQNVKKSLEQISGENQKICESIDSRNSSSHEA